MTIVTETTYKHEATGIEATPTTLDGKPVIAVNAGDLIGDVSRDTARALVEVLQAALGDAPKVDSDGWIAYASSFSPFPEPTLVDVVYRHGGAIRRIRAEHVTWRSIIAYRIVKESE